MLYDSSLSNFELEYLDFEELRDMCFLDMGFKQLQETSYSFSSAKVVSDSAHVFCSNAFSPYTGD